MRATILRRLATAVPTIVLSTVLIFGLRYLLPGGPIEAILGALGARLDVRVLWNGPELERLLDAGHAPFLPTAFDDESIGGADEDEEVVRRHHLLRAGAGVDEPQGFQPGFTLGFRHLGVEPHGMGEDGRFMPLAD